MKYTTIALGIAVVILLVGIFSLLSSDEIYRQNLAHGYCLESGYPGFVENNGLFYCIKTINGTDTVIRWETIADK